MRRSFATTAIAFTIALWFTMMFLPREWSSLLWLLQSRVTRKIFGGPAPFEGKCVTVPGIDPDVVIVSLASGHSVAQHGSTIHRNSDLEQAIISVEQFHDPLFGDITTYKAKTSDESLIAAIRSDYGVQYVTCDEPPMLPAVIRHPSVRIVKLKPTADPLLV